MGLFYLLSLVPYWPSQNIRSWASLYNQMRQEKRHFNRMSRRSPNMKVPRNGTTASTNS